MQPNILYIHSHDTGRYIQPFGHAVSTPHLQQLAEAGVFFRNNFCIHPTCSPSRAALLTGCYPHENGMLGLAHRGFGLNSYQQHLIHTLRPHGYRSILTGMQHIAAAGGDKAPWQIIGYDAYLPGEPEEEAAEYFKSNPEEPFFISVGFEETHREFPPLDEADDPRYCLPPAPLPDTPETRQDMARFKASASILDQKIGKVLNALQTAGIADRTLVICTTDHGIAFPRMKCNLQDSGTGVFLIIRGPGGFNGGQVVDAMTSHLDLFPTICDLLKIEPPSWLRGKSLLPLIHGAVDNLHEALFTQVNYHAAYEPMRAVRTDRWKYIKRYDHRTRPVLPNCDSSESKSTWLAHGWETKAPEPEALYDLIFDPNETNNLINHPYHQAIAAKMRTLLTNWMHTTADPLLHGAVPAPADAVANDPDGLSPDEPTKTIHTLQ